jgi:2-hydroxychromene-2-carboxylate isomerase
MIVVQPASQKHIELMRTLTRPEDIEEVEEGSGLDFQMALSTLGADEVQAVLEVNSGDLLGLGGLQYINGYAVPWLILTTNIDKYRLEFLRFSKRYILNIVLPEHGEMTNLVYKRNKLHIDWLTWIGAEWLPYNDKFDQFILRERR